MPARIEDYAMIGDCQTAAMVSRTGSIDWLCLPRFDSPACFAALLGHKDHGRWLIAPEGQIRQIKRRYRPETLVLETEFETDAGVVTIVDCMTRREGFPELIRLVIGRSGVISMRCELIIRFFYGSIVPWVRRIEGGLVAIAGPDQIRLRTPVAMQGENFTSVGSFDVHAGQFVPFNLTWSAPHQPMPPEQDVLKAVEQTERWWRRWSMQCTYNGPRRETVLRSLITLKGLTYEPTGGIVAAPTTSLPEHLGGVRNWDYRFCWLRDATFTLYVLLISGFREEAHAWRDWLLRAVAGQPSQTQIMYGVGGERYLREQELEWLPGYENSGPVRIGNAAFNQHQLDVYGEVIGTLHQCRQLGLETDSDSWSLERQLLIDLETTWREPDEGIWEVRGPRRHFTHSKMMAWVAFDRGVKAVERFGLEGPVDRWRALRREVHAQVCREGFDSDQGAFVQAYGEPGLDASILMMPLVGFLPATDPRVQSTVAAVERELVVDGFVLRYRSDATSDGLPAGEGTFLPCSFWLADNYALMGRLDEARALFDRLLAIRNDVDLIAEEYEPKLERQLGNFPQAFTHVCLVNTAWNLHRMSRPWKGTGPVLNGRLPMPKSLYEIGSQAS